MVSPTYLLQVPQAVPRAVLPSVFCCLTRPGVLPLGGVAPFSGPQINKATRLGKRIAFATSSGPCLARGVKGTPSKRGRQGRVQSRIGNDLHTTSRLAGRLEQALLFPAAKGAPIENVRRGCLQKKKPSNPQQAFILTESRWADLAAAGSALLHDQPAHRTQTTQYESTAEEQQSPKVSLQRIVARQAHHASLSEKDG